MITEIYCGVNRTCFDREESESVSESRRRFCSFALWRVNTGERCPSAWFSMFLRKEGGGIITKEIVDLLSGRNASKIFGLGSVRGWVLEENLIQQISIDFQEYYVNIWKQD